MPISEPHILLKKAEDFLNNPDTKPEPESYCLGEMFKTNQTSIELAVSCEHLNKLQDCFIGYINVSSTSSPGCLLFSTTYKSLCCAATRMVEKYNFSVDLDEYNNWFTFKKIDPMGDA